MHIPGLAWVQRTCQSAWSFGRTDGAASVEEDRAWNFAFSTLNEDSTSEQLVLFKNICDALVSLAATDTQSGLLASHLPASYVIADSRDPSSAFDDQALSAAVAVSLS